jgi:hypothetical protein
MASGAGRRPSATSVVQRTPTGRATVPRIRPSTDESSAAGNSASNGQVCRCFGTVSPTPTPSRARAPLARRALLPRCARAAGCRCRAGRRALRRLPLPGHQRRRPRRGIGGERSGLWSEMFRLTRELRPRYLLVENVAALVTRGLDVVLADLASIGFDAEWDCLRASDFGAPHRRERIWLVAYPGSARRRQDARSAHGDEAADEGRRAQTITSLTVMVKAVERGLWPTPRATDDDKGGRGDLLAMVRTGKTSRRREWPTPTAQPRTHTGLQSRGG